MAAGRLGIGTSIMTRAGPALSIARLERRLGWVRVYNFEVDGFHTYFVGESGGGVWVHNAGLCDPQDPGLPSRCRAYRAAMRTAGIGRNGARLEATGELHSGSISPEGDPGVRTEWTNPDNGAGVHHDPYGNFYEPGSPQNIGPHYGVKFPDEPTMHFPYESAHDPALNR